MSLLPWVDDYRRHFGVRPTRFREFIYDPDDFRMVPFDHRPLMQWPSFVKQLNNLTLNEEAIKFDKDKFRVNIDVQQFSPEEITVKTSGNTVTIEAKHEEKQDEHGFISRHFVRRYTIPVDHDIGRIESHLSSDGVLSITAPKINTDGVPDQRTIQITQTGQPSQAVTKADLGEKEKCEKSKL